MTTKRTGIPDFPAGPILVYGFSTAIAVWIIWFLTHLPWLGLPESVSLPVILGAWLVGMIWAGRSTPERPALVGLGSGLVTAVLGLLILGSKIAQPAGASGVSTDVVPSAPLIAAGFLVLGAAVGLAGGLIGTSLRPRTDLRACPPGRWLGDFAKVAGVAVAPLLFVGGLVTSTNSGMAVPDWPDTFGSNMFLYPLGPRAAPNVFLEHSHRLFGALIGLTVLTLMVWIILFARKAREQRDALPGRVTGFAVAAFVLVCVQGILGGLRVTQNSRPLAIVHGMLAQLVFAVVVALAVVLSPAFQGAERIVGLDAPAARRIRRFCSALFHSMFLQLLLGAVYRQFRSDHVLWTHAAFSIVVTLLALLVGMSFASAAPRAGELARPLSRLGIAMIALVAVQFTLGWAAFFYAGPSLDPQSTGQSLLRTAHQTNGAFLLAAATAAFVWSRRLASDLSIPAPIPSTGRDSVPAS